jgi:hypothetical protein
MGFLGRWRQEAGERRRKRERNEEIAAWFIFAFILVAGMLIYREVEPLVMRIMPFLTGTESR